MTPEEQAKYLKCFGIAQADISNLTGAIKELTPVEFRLWFETLKTLENSHWSHHKGTQETFIKMGKWMVEDEEINR